MSFCLRPNVCKKCGKPLTMFEGWTCLECEKLEQESTVDVLEQIRAEIEHEADYQDAYVNADIAKGMYLALEIFDKYKGGDNK